MYSNAKNKTNNEKKKESPLRKQTILIPILYEKLYLHKFNYQI